MLATAVGHEEGLRLLLEAGANPDVRDEEGKTALMIACFQV
jgi:ankyrin repeat protein